MKRNPDNIAKFERVKSLADRLQSGFREDGEHIDITYTNLETANQNAIVFVDIAVPALFDTFKSRSLLSEIIINSDDVVVAPSADGEELRFSFGIRNVIEP